MNRRKSCCYVILHSAATFLCARQLPSKLPRKVPTTGRTTVQSISPFYWFITAQLGSRPSELCPSRTSLVPGLFYFCGPKKMRKWFGQLFRIFHLIFFMGSDGVLLQWKSAGAYHTFPKRKVMGCPPAIPNQSKSELRGTCSFYFFT